MVGSVSTIAEQLSTGGKILVGGSFTSVAGDSSKKYMIRLNSDGTLDTSFNIARLEEDGELELIE